MVTRITERNLVTFFDMDDLYHGNRVLVDLDGVESSFLGGYPYAYAEYGVPGNSKALAVIANKELTHGHWLTKVANKNRTFRGW